MTTANTLLQAFEKIQAHALTAGAKDAPTLATESTMAFPFSVVYPGSGTIGSESAGQERDLHNITLDVHVNRVDLPTDIGTAMEFFEEFKALMVADTMLGNTVSTIIYPMQYQFGNMEYAGTKTIGFRFSIVVKQRT